VSTTWTSQRKRARNGLRQALALEPFPLIEAAFWAAAEDYPSLDVPAETGRVTRMAHEAALRVRGMRNPFERLDGVCGYVFGEMGFRGNAEDFDDPRNSYLNEVVDRRLGIPITLSILFLEIASAAGFEARGVALPGHFVIRVEWDGRVILVDPFHQGQVITVDDCRQLVARSTGRPSLFRRDQLDGADRRAMLARMLLNLKHVYLGQADYARALSVVERLLLVLPGDSNEIRDRGFLRAHLGQPGPAISDLETYLTLAPGAPDAESVKGRLSWLRKRISNVSG
jgi:regulator of sirC expression with transglutaminase-like and TPR domain